MIVKPKTAQTTRSKLLCAAVVFACVVVCGAAMAAEIPTLAVISYPARPSKLPLWLAQDAGLFEKNGVKVSFKELNSSEELNEAIKKREGQIYAATANWLVSGIGDGLDLVFIANTGYSVLKLVARPALTRPQDLRGKKSAPASSTAARIGSRARHCSDLD